MSRKAGTPNKPKEQSIDCYKATATITTNTLPIDEKPKYFMLTGYKLDRFNDDVNLWIKDGYVCQGGASVTNYRALDGSIVMVYCQGMVKRE